jgi:3-oxoacyl-[acyl-carrier protein] reductase
MQRRVFNVMSRIQSQVGKTIDAILARFGRIDTLVNNAGVHRGGKVHRLTDEAWQEVLQVNLTGAMNMTRSAVVHMAEGSSVVNVGAVVGFRGFPATLPMRLLRRDCQA